VKTHDMMAAPVGYIDGHNDNRVTSSAESSICD